MGGESELPRYREEVLNVTLAHILTGYGLPANPEIIVSKSLPDVRIIIGGLKVILEGKSEKARKALLKQAKERLEAGLADISIAIFYPDRLFEARDSKELADNMAVSRYSGTFYHWSTSGITTLELQEKSIKELVEVLNRVFALYVSNDLLSKKISEIEMGITQVTGEGQQRSLVLYSPAVVAKLRQALGIGEEKNGEEEED